MGHFTHGLQTEVAAISNLPLIINLDQDRTCQAKDRRVIPVRTYAQWDDARPGFVEMDLVAHCGDTTAGQYINTLSVVDISTGWTECLAAAAQAAQRTLQARPDVVLCFLYPDVALYQLPDELVVNAWSDMNTRNYIVTNL